MEINLHLKTALVGGSTQGIGLAIAKAFAEAGATCLLLARNEEKLKETVASLPGQSHRYAVADFADTASVKNAAARLIGDSVVHILVNNTGGPAPGPITEAGPAVFLGAFQQHLVNNQQLAQLVLPGMKAEGYGRIINIVSTSVRIPIPNLGVSNTIRGAVASWAKTLSNEVAGYGVTVNNILPGLTETERLASLIRSEAARRGVTPEEVAADMKKTVPAGRFGKSEELASLACFLASPLAGYINGGSIAVDGGKTGSL